MEAVKNIKNVAEKMRPKYFDFRLFVIICMMVIFGLSLIKLGLPNSLDARFYYSNEEAIKFFKLLGDHDYYRYIATEIFDLGFIASYTAFWFLSLKRLKYQNQQIKYVALIPGFFDFIETATILLILVGELSIKSITWLGYATAAKWTFSGFITIVYFFAIFRRFYPKKQKL